MKQKFVLFLIAFTYLFAQNSYGQRVGLVLSGGGATGLAHIGVLKALEEAEIPIDYITGSSIGALIGAMYSVGYSPDEIKDFIISNNFDKMNSSEMTKKERFFLREKDNDASIINFKLAKDSVFKKSLPTNFVTPSILDYQILKYIGLPNASYGKDFDSLFVPFRCVATDVYKKESIIFKDGDLNAAVRASMTYPFYLNPIRINGALLFDGGLYNNFPADVMYQDFDVDYIIGSNVSSNDGPPKEDDLFSQLSTMFISKTNYSLPCENGIIIEPNSDVGTFDFSKADRAIRRGYQIGLQHIDSIKEHVKRRVTVEELEVKRQMFRKNIQPVVVNELTVNSYTNENVSFVKTDFMKDSLGKPLSEKRLSRAYFRAYATPQVRYLYPTLTRNSDTTYRLGLDVGKQRPIALALGGHFSTRSVSTAYIGVSYYDMGVGAAGIHAESYFGKFYTSVKTKIDYDLPTLFPMRMSPYFVLNRWDFFKSNSTFFQDVEPSFLLQNELYYGMSFAIPSSNNGKVAFDLRKFQNKDRYYQTLNYSEADTADVTSFNGESFSLSFFHNTLNRKQWASEGAKVEAKVRYVQGKEISISGNTPTTDYDLRRYHRWISVSLEGQQYFKMNSFFKLGLYGKAVINSQSLFANYTASMLAMSEFSPLPDSRTVFMEEYRASQYIGAGINFIFNYKNFLEFRIDPYFFQPLRKLNRHEDDSFGYSELFDGGLPMAGASVIFHSPLGPLRFTTNWFPKQAQPFMVQLSFGYVIFNERSVR